MAFVLLGPINRYLCVSTDTKPTTAIATGSVCQETDTGKEYWFNGAAWVEQIGSIKLAAGTAEIGKLAAGTAEIGKLGAGTAVIGKVGTDPTTDGTTNRVVAKISQVAGENVVTVGGSLPSLSAGTANIGDVDLASAIPAGTNTIGGVTRAGDNLVSASIDGASATGLDVSKYNSGLITCTLGWTTIHFEASYDDGTSWQPLEVIRQESGSKFYRLDIGGVSRYTVDLRGVQKIRMVIDYAGTAPRTANILLSLDQPIIPTSYLNRKKLYKPTQPSMAYTATTVGRRDGLGSDRIIVEQDVATGDLYAATSSWLEKSTDYGATWADLKVFEVGVQNCQTVKKLDNGALLAFIREAATTETVLMLSDASEANFAEVLRFTEEGSVATPGWGISVYKNVILFTQYANRPVSVALHIYLSTDYGATWAAIKAAPTPLDVDWHFHDVVYDPYRNLIWYLNGDGGELANIGYSDDWGVTWNTLWTAGAAYTQSSTIHPMPDMVLFGSDQSVFAGVHRLLTFPAYAPNQTGSVPYVLEPAYGFTKPGAWFSAAMRGKQAWDCGGAAYFTTANSPVIIATKDGITFYQLFKGLAAPGGLTRLFGVDDTGKLCGQFRVDGTDYLYVFDAPTWEEM
jgi:hypothetical protein